MSHVVDRQAPRTSGPGGEKDVKTYVGLTISSDPLKYSMIEEGFYRGSWQQMGTSPYGKGSLTYRISNENGSTRLFQVLAQRDLELKDKKRSPTSRLRKGSQQFAEAATGC